jgi:hypothetical protein
MALEKKSSVDKLEIVNADSIPMIQVRSKVFVQDTETGEVVGAPTYHRHVVTPASELREESSQVQAMAMALFTQEVKDAYAASIAVTEEV